MKRLAVVSVALTCAASLPVDATHGGPHVGDTSVFTTIGQPGSPEGIAVHDGVVYVGTHTSVVGNADGPPSKIFRFALADATPMGEITIEGQDTGITHGVLAIVIGPDGALYVVDRNPGRIVRVELPSGAQTTYATIPDLAPCALAPAPCSQGAFSAESTFADYIAFAPDGSAYVTDLQASTIFRVPAGGGDAAIWYQDARFDSVFGLNGITVNPAGDRLFFAMTGSLQPATPVQGIIYSLPIVTAPQPANLDVFHVFTQPAAGPDGIAFGASGRLYVVLAGSNQVAILDPDGSEVAIFPDPLANQMQDIPYDLPASVAFDGAGSLLVTNQSFFAGDESHWAVLRAFVGDTAE